jgi:hypothetical protein
VGSNLIHYLGNCSAPTVNMVKVKLHLNSVISRNNPCYCTIDLKNFYLNTPMDQPEYMCMKISNLHPNFNKIYNLTNLATTTVPYLSKFKRACMDSHRPASSQKISSKKELNQHGYQQSKVTPDLWKHDWQPISFTFSVDEFGIK